MYIEATKLTIIHIIYSKTSIIMKLAEVIVAAFFCVAAVVIFVLVITVSVMELVNEYRAKREKEKQPAQEAA